VKGVPYWGEGDIIYDDLNNMVKALKLVGLVQDPPDWSKLVDESFLPADLRRK